MKGAANNAVVGACVSCNSAVCESVHILSAHRSAGERGSVSPGRPRGRRRSFDEDGARDVDYRKHKLSKNAMLRTIDADDDHGNDDSDGEDEEGVVKAWEGQQHPHASRPSVHPITHTEEKCERFCAILYVPHMYNIVKLILLSSPKFF